MVNLVAWTAKSWDTKFYFCGGVLPKGLSQVLDLSGLYFYTKVKPKTWLRHSVNTTPGLKIINYYKVNSLPLGEM